MVKGFPLLRCPGIQQTRCTLFGAAAAVQMQQQGQGHEVSEERGRPPLTTGK